MKVVLIYLGRRGGGTVYSLEIAKRLNKKINLLCVISTQIENLCFWKKNNLNIYTISTYNNFFSFFISLIDFKKFFILYKKIKEFNPDLVYYPFFFYWLPIMNILFSKIPKVYTVHDIVSHVGEKNFLMEIIQKKTIKESQGIILLSEAFKEKVASHLKKSQNLEIIPHGIFDYYLENFSKKETKHPPTILFFGRILKYKGLEILLKSFSIIKKEIPNSRLLIVGRGSLGAFKNFLNDESISVENRWIKDEEVGKYFSQSDVVVCPYLEASQSGVIPLAYAFKIPVIASRVGGLVEQVENGITGFLVEPKDHLLLAEKIIFLLKNEKERKIMGENGFYKAQKEWNWEKISEKILLFFKRTTGK